MKSASEYSPLRKPHRDGTRHFCSQKCGNLVSAREYRKTKATELRAKEKQRNKQRAENGYFELLRSKKDTGKTKANR